MLVLALFAMVTAVSAQVSLGVKGGINMSNLYGDELDNENVKIGFNVGLLADIDFFSIWQFKLVCFLLQKGISMIQEI